MSPAVFLPSNETHTPALCGSRRRRLEGEAPCAESSLQKPARRSASLNSEMDGDRHYDPHQLASDQAGKTCARCLVFGSALSRRCEVSI